MNTVEIKIATLKAVQKCQPLEKPAWPTECTIAIIQELISDGLLEWKVNDQKISAGWSTIPVSIISSGQFHVTDQGKKFINEHGVFFKS